MLTTVNGRVRSSRTNINGLFDTVADLLGDECKRECDVKYAGFSQEMTSKRQACKQACEENKDFRPLSGESYQFQQKKAGPEVWIAAGLGGVLLYQLFKKPRKKGRR